MEDFWARYIGPSGQPGPNYWNYFAERLADLATIPEGAAVLDIGTYDGNVLIKAMKKAGTRLTLIAWNSLLQTARWLKSCAC